MKEYIFATTADLDTVYEIVQNSIKSTYPKYYPNEVVDFFCCLHSKENILRDIEDNLVGILVINGKCVGTGCHKDNHITRVYVEPKYQGKGYGTYIMDRLEEYIAKKASTAVLDASLPASHLYSSRGYKTVEHCKYQVENNVILVYEVMEKNLTQNVTDIDYNGKIFVPLTNSENGEVDGNTVFHYHQSGFDFTADYSGGEIKTGYMVGKVNKAGELDFYYVHLNIDDDIRVGKCHSIPVIKDNGIIELHEKWQWFNGDCSSGESVVIEQVGD